MIFITTILKKISAWLIAAFILCQVLNCNSQKYVGSSLNNQDLDTFTSIQSKVGLPVSEFELKVPINYNHFTQLDSFVFRNESSWVISWQISDKVFSKSTNKLVNGNSYKVKIFPLLTDLSFEECINFMKSQNAIMVNAQGLILAYTLSPNKFPRDRWIASFDEKDRLALTPNLRYEENLIPMLGLSPNRPHELNVYRWNIGWGTAYYLLCFYEMKETTK